MSAAYVLDAGVAVAAAALCLRASRLGTPRGRRGWRCHAAAAGSWALHALLLGLAPHSPGARAAAGVAAAVFVALVTVGTWLISRTPDVRARIRMLLDGVTGATAAFVLLWVAALSPAWEAAGRGSVLAHLLPPFAPLALALFSLTITLAEIPPSRRRMPLLLCGALVAAALAETARSLRLLGGAADPGAAAHAGWLVCFGLLGAAALAYRGTSSRLSTASTHAAVGLAPYALVAPAGAVLVWQNLAGQPIDAVERWTATAMVGLVMLRQFVTLAENRDLVRRLAAQEAELRHRATHDALTGLAGRGRLMEALEAAAAEGPAGVLLVDLDGFKQVNDTLGHAAGDALLVEVAGRLRGALDEADLPARLGGDEFAVVVPGPPERAHRTAAHLRDLLAQPYDVLGSRVDRVSASIGVARSSGGTGASELLHAADVAMYAAKRAGKGRVRAADPLLPPAPPVPRRGGTAAAPGAHPRA